ncbi:MAG: peptidylprolyl isomerase [Deltaproteobacteria bacterium]|nr:peptidylprolyl isomerase [Deltaproteobacteria bacterium]
MTSFTKRMILTSVFLAFFAPVAYSATAPAKEPQKAVAISSPTEIVAKVNGKNITKDHLEIAVNSLLPIMTYHNTVNTDKLKDIEKKAIENIINNELIYKAAKDAKLDDVNQKDIDAEVKKLKKQLPKGDTLEKVLKRSSMTMADLRDDFKKDIVVKKMAKVKGEEIKKKSEESVNEAFMKDYYQKNLNKFKEPEQIRLRSILIKADPSGGQRAWNDSLKKAQEISKKAKAGEDFAKLAETNSQDPFAKKGGDMGWAHKGSLFPEIDTAAGKMKVGEVSDPIMTIYGYHIIKFEENKPTVQKKFEDLNQKSLEKELEQKEYKRLWDEWIKGLRASAQIEILKPDLK